MDDDTMIGLYHYQEIKSIPQPWRYNYLAVREDTTGKVYFLIDSTETLIYDFSLQVGDTLRIINQLDTFQHLLSEIDSVIINSDTHRVFNFTVIKTKPVTTELDYKVIEGIGCIKGFLFPYYPRMGLAVTKLICFTASTGTPEVIPPVEHFDNKKSCKVSVKNIIDNKQSVVISPHPANSSSIITLPYTLQKGELTIYNTIGQIVRQVSFSNTPKVTIGQLPVGGMYYYRVSDKSNGEMWQGKMAYE
ncbi:MAG: T9SS type A sorting domain-containing protein [Taibaiella sp.]|nr:T9SS type A sorting domain-containing protein [Taibaiella sp.]